MKSVELNNATAALKDYTVRVSAAEPLVVTRKGKAVAALVRIHQSDVESLLLSSNPRFQAIIRKSRASLKRSGGLTPEQIEARIAGKAKAPRAPKRATRARGA